MSDIGPSAQERAEFHAKYYAAIASAMERLRNARGRPASVDDKIEILRAADKHMGRQNKGYLCLNWCQVNSLAAHLEWCVDNRILKSESEQ